MTETVSSYFLRRVPERGAGEVHSVFRSSLNVMAEGFLVHLGGGDAPLSCLGINMDPGRMGALLPRVRPGDRAVFRDGTLRIYDREGVSLIPYREFATVPLELPRCSPPPPSLLRALEDLESVPGGSARQASLNYVPLEDWRELSRLRALQGHKKTEKE